MQVTTVSKSSIKFSPGRGFDLATLQSQKQVIATLRRALNELEAIPESLAREFLISVGVDKPWREPSERADQVFSNISSNALRGPCDGTIHYLSLGHRSASAKEAIYAVHKSDKNWVSELVVCRLPDGSFLGYNHIGDVGKRLSVQVSQRQLDGPNPPAAQPPPPAPKWAAPRHWPPRSWPNRSFSWGVKYAVATDGVWGVEFGRTSVKGVKLRVVSGRCVVEAADVVAFPIEEVPTPEHFVRALKTLTERTRMWQSPVVVSVLDYQGIAISAKLPPTVPKNITNRLREMLPQSAGIDPKASICRWHPWPPTSQADPASYWEGMLVAINREPLTRMEQLFMGLGLRVIATQLAPLALYNALVFEDALAQDAAVAVIDMGAENTSLLIADRGRLWTRRIPLGGWNFTKALMRELGQPFAAAEEVKREVRVNVDAKRWLQAMRPVYQEVGSELQRTLQSYRESHPATQFREIIAVGCGFYLPGLMKHLESFTNIPVRRPERFRKLQDAEQLDFTLLATAGGLALQGLSRAAVATNLLPDWPLDWLFRLFGR